MKILAIDPGPEMSAFVCWDTYRNDFISARLRHGIFENHDLCYFIRTASKAFKLIAIEMVQSYGMGVGRSTFETCLWAGRFVECGGKNKIKMYGRPTIKGQIGGRNDAEIRASLRIRYGEAKKGEKLEGVKKDIWSALALAVAITENPNLKQW